LNFFSKNFRQNIDSTISLNTQHSNAIYTSRPLSEMILTIKNSRKRDNIELEIKTQNNGMLNYISIVYTVYTI